MTRFEVWKKKEKCSAIKVNRQKEEISQRSSPQIRFASLWGKGQKDTTWLPKIKGEDILVDAVCRYVKSEDITLLRKLVLVTPDNLLLDLCDNRGRTTPKLLASEQDLFCKCQQAQLSRTIFVHEWDFEEWGSYGWNCDLGYSGIQWSAVVSLLGCRLQRKACFLAIALTTGRLLTLLQRGCALNSRLSVI